MLSVETNSLPKELNEKTIVGPSRSQMIAQHKT